MFRVCVCARGKKDKCARAGGYRNFSRSVIAREENIRM